MKDCKDHRERIKDEAAEVGGAGTSAGRGGSSRRRDQEAFDAHLAACPQCRLLLERERALLAAVDRSLAASLAARPSPAFAAGVRERIAEEGARAQFWPNWLKRSAPWAVGALAASLAVAVWVGRRQKPQVSGQGSGVRSQPLAVSGQEPKVNRHEFGPTQRPAVSRRSLRSASERATASNREPRAHSVAGPDLAVVVPKGQAAAVMELYDSLWVNNQELATSAENHDAAGSEIDVKPLDVKPLEIQPLPGDTLEAGVEPSSTPDDPTADGGK